MPVARARCPPFGLPEDAVQDAYIRAFRAFDGFRGNDPRPWLLAIVRNVAYSTFNTRKRSRNVIGLIEDSKEQKKGCAEAATRDSSPETIALERVPMVSRSRFEQLVLAHRNDAYNLAYWILQSRDDAVINQQEHNLLLEALAGLSPVQRDILILREMEGLPYKDIANLMVIEIGTVMSRLSRSRAELSRGSSVQSRPQTFLHEQYSVDRPPG
jgi:RNA polymerase sigma-70 factor, ECF subfamily